MPSAKRIAVLAALASLTLPVRAQSFDAVSIKRSDRGFFVYKFEEHRFIARNISLDSLIAVAYNLPLMGARLLYGGPGWIRLEHFDVEGKVEFPPDTPPGERATKMRLMLRTVLADRFKLVLRTETKDLPIYTLTLDKGGPKLKPSPMSEKDCAAAPIATCHFVRGGPAVGMHAKAAGMDDIVRGAETFADRPIVDQTGLPGLYEVDTSGWADMSVVPGTGTWDNPVDASGPSLFAIFQRLGLKMQVTRGPAEIYVVDHAERPSAS